LPRQRLVHQTAEFEVDSLAHWKPVQLAEYSLAGGILNTTCKPKMNIL